MAIYDFKCETCHEVIEIVQSIKDDTILRTCPFCAGESVKQISRSTFILRGSNWSHDNYNGKGKK